MSPDKIKRMQSAFFLSLGKKKAPQEGLSDFKKEINYLFFFAFFLAVFFLAVFFFAFFFLAIVASLDALVVFVH